MDILQLLRGQKPVSSKSSGQTAKAVEGRNHDQLDGIIRDLFVVILMAEFSGKEALWISDAHHPSTTSCIALLSTSM